MLCVGQLCLALLPHTAADSTTECCLEVLSDLTYILMALNVPLCEKLKLDRLVCIWRSLGLSLLPL